jgi:hypothetical protein
MLARTLRWQTAIVGVAVIILALLAKAGSTGVAVAGPAVPGTGDWPMVGDGPAHNSVNRAERTLSPSTVFGLKVLHTYPAWSLFGLDWPTELVAGSIGYGETYGSYNCGPYLCTNVYVTAFQLPTGTRLWRRVVEVDVGGGLGNCLECIPAISNGVLYVGGDNAMYAFNASTGIQL